MRRGQIIVNRNLEAVDYNSPEVLEDKDFKGENNYRFGENSKRTRFERICIYDLNS